MSHTEFWAHINAQLDAIERKKPDTAQAVADLLDPPSSADAFFAGSGGDRQLLESITDAGWRIADIEAEYYWVARHPTTRETIGYAEGDVYLNPDPQNFILR